MKLAQTIKIKGSLVVNQLVISLLLVVFTILVKVFTYKTLARWLPQAGNRVPESWRTRRLAVHASQVARWIPGATCLPQALASYFMLAAQGYECSIRIGVSHGVEKGFRAHATLMSGDKVIIGGGGDWDQFVPLTDLRPGK